MPTLMRAAARSAPWFRLLSRRLVALVLGLTGCSAAPAQQAISPRVTIHASPMAVTHTPPPVESLRAQRIDEWQPMAGASGVETLFYQARANERDEWVLAVRIDPSRVDLRVMYEPDSPRTVREWHARAGADAVINGGFFDGDNRVTGLLIADGQRYGRSYRGFGGMLAWVRGAPDLTWLREQPYRPGEQVEQAVQGFPMLVVDGGTIEGMSDNGEINRRSFAAVDRAGRLILGVTQMGQWSLTDLAQYLATDSHIQAWRALNLDGGASSGLWISEKPDISMNSFDPVPAVIAVNNR